MIWENQKVTADAEPPSFAPLRFERRAADRWSTNIIGTIFELGGEGFGRMHQIRVVDFSDSSCGAISDSPLTPGSIISIGFSAPGMYAKRGTVIRCTPAGDGYRLAVQFELRLAA